MGDKDKFWSWHPHPSHKGTYNINTAGNVEMGETRKALQSEVCGQWHACSMTHSSMSSNLECCSIAGDPSSTRLLPFKPGRETSSTFISTLQTSNIGSLTYPFTSNSMDFFTPSQSSKPYLYAVSS